MWAFLQNVLNQQKKIDNLLFKILGSAVADFYMTLIRDQSLFIEKTAHEIIWGYNDPLMQTLGLTNDPLIKLQVSLGHLL